MSMDITMQSDISRRNVRGFVQGFEDAVVHALQRESGQYRVYESQVAVDAVWAKNTEIWSRPSSGHINEDHRRLQTPTNQKLRVDFTYSCLESMHNSMPLSEMLRLFNRQLRSPVSPLMRQPLFYGSVVHIVRENAEGSNYNAQYTLDGSSGRMDVQGVFANKPDESVACRPTLLFGIVASLLFTQW